MAGLVDGVVLPVGTVSMLFSDIEGSTVLAQQLGRGWEGVLASHRVVCREAWLAHGGVEMGTEGDSFFVVFASADEAVAAAVAAQRGLGQVEWPTDVAVRVRMGVHTGTPRRHEDGYVGTDVHKSARIAACAHGGQVLLSETTVGLARSGDGAGLLPGIGFKDLGEHRVKGLESPVRLFQLTAAGLADGFAAPRSLGGSHNLPTAGSPLVGREVELSELVEWLRAGQGRLVTVTGPGGSGKTRLAIGVAEAVAGEVSDGVRFVPLAPVTTGEAMWSTISQALELPADAYVPPEFFDQVGSSDAVWVLDNLEQLSAAAEVVGQILEGAPRVRVVATSRSPLHLGSEREFPLAPLSLPTSTSWEAVSGSGAVQFFVQCAARVRRGFELTRDNSTEVAALAVARDGLPLAIELTTARLKLFSVKQLLGRLDSVLDVSSARVDREASDRQRTLRSTLEWSYQLLPPVQQQLLTRLGVFAGGASLEAVSYVCGDLYDGDEDGLVEGLLGLVDSSFVQVRYDTEPTRFTMLETVRRYAQERLDASPDAASVYRTHAQHFLNTALELRNRGNDGEPTHREFFLDLDNYRAVVARGLEGLQDPQDPAIVVSRLQTLGLVARLGFGFYLQGEIGDWLAGGLSGTPVGTDLVGQANVLGVLATTCNAMDRPNEAIGLCHIALNLLDLVDQSGQPPAPCPSWSSPEYVRIYALRQLLEAHASLGNTDQARLIAAQLLDSPHASPLIVYGTIGVLSELSLHEGDFDEAERLLLRVQQMAVEAHDTWELMWSESMLGELAVYRGDWLAARQRINSVVRLIPAGEYPEHLATALDLYATVVGRTQPLLAARTLGCAHALRGRYGIPSSKRHTSAADLLADIRNSVDPKEWAQAFDAGTETETTLILEELATFDETGQSESKSTAPER